MVTIDFGPIGPIDMTDMDGVWAQVFAGPDFMDNFDGLYPEPSLRTLTHTPTGYQLDTHDGVDGTTVGSGAAVWFFGHNFGYTGLGQPNSSGTVTEVQVYNADDVNNGFETWRVLISGFQEYFAAIPVGSGITPAYTAVLNKDLDPLIDDLSGGLTVYAHNSSDILVGTAFADQLFGYGGRDLIMGGGGSDLLFGGAGRDRLLAGDGNDTLYWGRGDRKSDGGAGIDTLKILGDTDLTAVSNNAIRNVERFSMTGGGNDTLTLGSADVLEISASSNTLKIFGNAGDELDIAGSYRLGAPSGGFDKYRLAGGVVLLVDPDITVL